MSFRYPCFISDRNGQNELTEQIIEARRLEQA
jgi:hypothetical protein